MVILNLNPEIPNGAIQDYDKAIEINPRYLEAYDSRGKAELKLKDSISAAKDIKMAGIIRSSRRSGKIDLDEYQRQIRECDIEINKNENLSISYYNRAYAKSSLKDRKGAIKDYDKAIELDSNYIEAYNNRASVKYIQGDKKGACKDWHKASELGSKDADDFLKQYCK